ncbi:16S rRNA (guanine(966)-N(2))-methyltransferase RsmD [Aliidiomarina quisquiliarum]|uniref:16S rRNA (guanine(966)-N(2))-methyltransferase RsmD n=1 Tax=Aliidiomarina quisquiliarum TaxID=2938947 RepID=UPI00208F3C23|nr:16S rRNA (guanine(966)-N(2))-methyltransferase RsmD [Aliidiomarina quisquiliarum]MCO4322191.1 16S rRNA (guanine(966)-N(2))-methyltransferase RsmD [Aliidiomarina quisquiliarum]
MARKKTTAAMGQIRIIGGRWRGRKLPVLDADGLRPTTDRLKETVFNWLQFKLADVQVLDIFAGTGSLGIEALSRGAAHVIFFEQEPASAQQLTTNLATLQAENISQVHPGNALTLLAQASVQQACNLVFIDPPFHKNLANQAIELLAKHNWLAENALVYLETEVNAAIQLPSHWNLQKEKIMGQSSARLYLTS